jgi:hypothetical protein
MLQFVQTLTNSETIMSETKYSFEKDLHEATAMAEGLAEYVRIDMLYGKVGSGGMFGGGKMPSLTIGALLMRIRRLSVLNDQLNSNQQTQLQKVVNRHDAVVEEWRFHYEQKLVREAKSRLDAMSTYFDECRSDPILCASAYLPEAFRRTVVQECLLGMVDLNIEIDAELNMKLEGTDGRLHALVRPADFIWSQKLMPAYPRDDYWWLYTQPPKP